MASIAEVCLAVHQQDRMLPFDTLHLCRSKIKRAAVLPSPEGLQLNTASPLQGSRRVGSPKQI